MKQILLLLSCALVAQCSTITPQQAQDWANVGHTVVHNGLTDAKDVLSVSGK